MMKLCKECKHFDQEAESEDVCLRHGLHTSPVTGRQVMGVASCAKERYALSFYGGQPAIQVPCGMDAFHFQPKEGA
jgi:hypothetical protein